MSDSGVSNPEFSPSIDRLLPLSRKRRSGTENNTLGKDVESMVYLLGGGGVNFKPVILPAHVLNA